jgi:hypothetical protein
MIELVIVLIALFSAPPYFWRMPFKPIELGRSEPLFGQFADKISGAISHPLQSKGSACGLIYWLQLGSAFLPWCMAPSSLRATYSSSGLFLPTP